MEQIKSAKIGDQVLVKGIHRNAVKSTVIGKDENNTILGWRTGDEAIPADAAKREMLGGYQYCLAVANNAECTIIKEASLREAKPGDRVVLWLGNDGHLSMDKTNKPIECTVYAIRNGGTSIDVGWRSGETYANGSLASNTMGGFVFTKTGLDGSRMCIILPSTEKPADKPVEIPQPTHKIKDLLVGDKVQIYVRDNGCITTNGNEQKPGCVARMVEATVLVATAANKHAVLKFADDFNLASFTDGAKGSAQFRGYENATEIDGACGCVLVSRPEKKMKHDVPIPTNKLSQMKVGDKVLIYLAGGRVATYGHESELATKTIEAVILKEPRENAPVLCGFEESTDLSGFREETSNSAYNGFSKQIAICKDCNTVLVASRAKSIGLKPVLGKNLPLTTTLASTKAGDRVRFCVRDKFVCRPAGYGVEYETGEAVVVAKSTSDVVLGWKPNETPPVNFTNFSNSSTEHSIKFSDIGSYSKFWSVASSYPCEVLGAVVIEPKPIETSKPEEDVETAALRAMISELQVKVVEKDTTISELKAKLEAPKPAPTTTLGDMKLGDIVDLGREYLHATIVAKWDAQKTVVLGWRKDDPRAVKGSPPANQQFNGSCQFVDNLKDYDTFWSTSTCYSDTCILSDRKLSVKTHIIQPATNGLSSLQQAMDTLKLNQPAEVGDRVRTEIFGKTYKTTILAKWSNGIALVGWKAGDASYLHEEGVLDFKYDRDITITPDIGDYDYYFTIKDAARYEVIERNSQPTHKMDGEMNSATDAIKWVALKAKAEAETPKEHPMLKDLKLGDRVLYMAEEATIIARWPDHLGGEYGGLCLLGWKKDEQTNYGHLDEGRVGQGKLECITNISDYYASTWSISGSTRCKLISSPDDEAYVRTFVNNWATGRRRCRMLLIALLAMKPKPRSC